MIKALRVMRVLLAVMTVAVCLLLCWQAIDIHRVGNLAENFSAPGVRIHPVYSPAIVRERLSAVAPALWGYLTAVVLGLVMQVAAGEKPASQGKPLRCGDAPAKPVSSALRIALYAAAVVLIVLGVMNGGLRDVLIKAINICTECIGLG